MKVNRFQGYVNMAAIIVVSLHIACARDLQLTSTQPAFFQQAMHQTHGHPAVNSFGTHGTAPANDNFGQKQESFFQLAPSQSALRSFKEGMHVIEDNRAVIMDNHKPKQESRTSVFQESFMNYVREIYNQRDYPLALSQDGSHILQFMELSNELNLGPETVYLYMRLFYNKIKSCEVIDYAMILQLLDAVPSLLERHFIADQDEDDVGNTTDLSFIKHHIESTLISKMTENFPLFQAEPDIFLSNIAQDLAHFCRKEIDSVKKDQQAAVARERLRQIIIKFFDTALNKLMWTTDNYENPWKAFVAISEGLMGLAETGVISHMDDLDDLLWSLTHRFCFYLDLAGASLPGDIFDDIDDDLEMGSVAFLEYDEQDEGIISKKEMLWECLAQARMRACAYLRSGIISMPVINHHKELIMNNDIKVGQVYKHYSGKEYRILGCSRHSETLEEMVVYQGLYDCPKFGPNPLWVRPKSMFTQEVMVKGVAVPRFALQKEV